MEDVRRKATFVTRLMETQPRSRLLINAAIGVILFLSPALRAEAADKPKVTDLGYAKITDLMTKDLVNVPPGKEVTMITVDYAPGGADPVHRHNAQAFVYVLEGSIVMQMKGEKEVTLHPGERSTKTLRAFTSSAKMPATRNPPKLSSFWSKKRCTNFYSRERVTPCVEI